MAFNLGRLISDIAQPSKAPSLISLQIGIETLWIDGQF